MKALFVTVRMKPEYRDQILKSALEDRRGSRDDEPGCLRFDVFQDDSDPNTIYFYEVYRDDAALEAHRAAPHYPACDNLPADWFVGQKAVAIRGEMIAPWADSYR
jgi:(4S)-4-hydroxy-5-phosphonooxypentane-2,3-dione isomerase